MAGADRVKYDKIRQKLVDILRQDLMGPGSPDEVLTESPKNAYLVGVLAPGEKGASQDAPDEQELLAEQAYGDGGDYSVGDEDDNQPITPTKVALPSSVGISFYVDKDVDKFQVVVSWGDYLKSTKTELTSKGKEKEVATYSRIKRDDTVVISLSSFEKATDIPLPIDSKVSLHISKMMVKTGYTLVTVYLVNNRTNASNEIESLMFQVHLQACSIDDSMIFVAENICRDVIEEDEVFFEERPIIGRGRGCSASWEPPQNGKTNLIRSDFIPEYHFPSVSASLKGFDDFFFSMISLSASKKKDEIIKKLKVLSESYENWIDKTLRADPRMGDSQFKDKIGDNVIGKCEFALSRMKEGISLLETDELVFDAFCFMNRVMIMQNSIKNYAKKHGSGIECSFADFSDLKQKKNDFAWRPFQIAFVLMNIPGMVDPKHQDRRMVDLLYFPTGGGKTEAYLGLMAFVIANRRLRASDDDSYNRDGGVTAILRYTLRLLTTQQRDRITKMVVAAELIRQSSVPKYGKEPISIGFWVGGGVTPNKFELLEPNDKRPQDARDNRNLLYKQLLTCPFCGKPLKDEHGSHEKNFIIDTERHSVEIYCLDPDCMFYKYKGTKPTKIPVYLVDEEIYERCPTIILSTVDKFARLPWDVKTNALFGRVDQCCSRHGYVAIGDHHAKHNKTDSNPKSELTPIRPFLPPELIIQDELHLISGPLGTIYGAYETIVEEMCSYSDGDDRIKPKYVVSTATIKNAEEQTRCLYARNKMSQFPPNGFVIGDSFFITEIPVEQNPFRKYVGVCATGPSVKSTLLRVYAILLEAAYNYADENEWKDVIDPYYTLVGYYNSIRELGGAVRLLQDDIPKRIGYLKKKFGFAHERHLNRSNNVEITSRMSSSQIPEQLAKLETNYTEKNCLDTAVATNMIAVGMDVDRLGLMVVTGQPKQNSEYIQATSRIGRAFPGLVVVVYNPYRPRDMSHYENFMGYHSQLYRFVEGTTATPFSARARDRVLHALIISAIRLKYPEMANNEGAENIADLTPAQISEVKNLVFDRLKIVKPEAKKDADAEIEQFLDKWKLLASQQKKLRYFVPATDKCNRLMNYYGEFVSDDEKATMNSMREVEKASSMYYWEG